MESEIQKQNKIKAKQVKAVATPEQMKVIEDMQSGTEYLFLVYLGKGQITVELIDRTLMIMVNSVEGDVSQLEDEHAEYARKKGWLKDFEPAGAEEETEGTEEPHVYNVRTPTRDEKEDLKRYYIGIGQDEETAQETVKNYFFVVITNYMTDCPGYRGKLLMAVYGCPEFYECFIWIDGKITKVEIDEGMINKQNRGL